MAVEEGNTSQYNADFMGAALNAGTQFALAGASARQNEKNREFAAEQAQINRDFQKEMYQRQLDDSIDWRAHQEAFNSPEAQLQRYREAGINPMYYVTGNGGNQLITTPMQANGSGYGASAGNPQSHRIEFHPLELAQYKVLSAQAEYLRADARLKNADAYTREFDNQALMILDRSFIGHDSLGGLSYHEYRAQIQMDAVYYKEKYQRMEFKDAADAFRHSAEVRKFEEALNENERKKFQYELSQCASAAELLKVSANWARANQWIDAGAKVLSSAVGIYSATKGTSINPTTTRTLW